MILCWIILIVGIICTTFGAIVLYKFMHDCYTSLMPVGAFSFGLGFAATLVAVVLLIAIPIQSQKELNTFISQKEYIENYKPVAEYDTAAITNKKIELNEWLYSVQYTKEHHPICSFYGDEILGLEPIK